MSSMTNFQDWLDGGNEPDSFDDAYALRMACDGDDCGIYDVARNNGKLFIKGPSGDTLVLASADAVLAFKKLVDGYKPDREMSWEAEDGFRRAMARDD